LASELVKAEVGNSSRPREEKLTGDSQQARRPRWLSQLAGAANWVAEHELWFLIMPAGLNLVQTRIPLQYVALSLSVIPVVWCCRRVATGSLTRRTPLDLPIVLILLTTLVGFYPSVDSGLTLQYLFKTVVEVALFYGLVNSIGSSDRLHVALWVLLASGVVMAGLGVVNTQLGTSKLFAFPQLYGRLPHLMLSRLQPLSSPTGFDRNILGGTLAVLVPVALALLMADSSAVERLISGLSVVILGGVTILTQSRGALGGLGVSLLFMLVWVIWHHRSLRYALIPLGMIIAAAIYFTNTVQLLEWLLSDTSMAMAGRVELWQRAIYILQDFPYTGLGPGTFSLVVPVLYPLFLIGPDVQVPHAHNLYLQTGVDLGVSGLVVFIALIVICLMMSIRVIRRGPGRDSLMGLGLVAGLLVYLVHGLTDCVGFSTKPGTVVWAIIGLITALYHQSGLIE